MLQAFVATPPCAVCGRPAAHIELVAPGAPPANWQRWSSQQRDAYNAARQRHDDQQWWLLFSGIEAGNGSGRPVDLAEAERLTNAFAQPYRYAAVASADFYDDAGFCGECDAPYCYHHWTCRAPDTGNALEATARASTRTGGPMMCEAEDRIPAAGSAGPKKTSRDDSL
ncbi:hypothetical protein AB0C44_00520 [Micromonospora taraxaci]|uniref:hypothetical protein n=1 Tax=Micromonospora taraxaci TaxID=1316803 RepID=UPI0033FC4294